MSFYATPVLAEIAKGRDHLTTAEFARATNRAGQTIRKNYCLTGECFGITPIKFGNRLLWPVDKIAALLAGPDTRSLHVIEGGVVTRRGIVASSAGRRAALRAAGENP